MSRTLYIHRAANDMKVGVFAGLDSYDRTHTGTRLVLGNMERFEISDTQARKIEQAFEDRTPFEIEVIASGSRVRIHTF